MQLTDKQIKEYQRIYKEYYGFSISYDEAREEGTSLVLLMKMIYKPITKEDYRNKTCLKNDDF